MSRLTHTTRLAQIAVLATLAAGRLAAQNLSPRAFSQVPFDQWQNEPERKGLRWSLHVADAELSNHQRLVSRLDITVDGAELAKRSGEGRFVILMQIEDEKGSRWRDFQSINLGALPGALKNSDAAYSRNFFVLPGDYSVVVAAYSTADDEHFLLRRKLHVSQLRNDPLPLAWSGLPNVEFVRLSRYPDNWYLPSIRNRIKLTAEPKRPMRIELVLNLSPPDNLAGSSRVRNRNLSALLPSFKVLSQLQHPNVKLNSTVVNLTRQQVLFQQNGANRLDWRKLMAAIGDDVPGIIDIKSLENRHSSPQFFASEVLQRLNPPRATTSEGGSAGDEPRVVIVLTSPVTFEDGADLHPIEAAPRSDAKIFYLRYQPFPTAQLTGGRRQGARRTPDGMLLPPRAGFGPVWDQLSAVLKPADPKVFDIATPEQFRKALATILTEIAKM